MPAGSLQQIDKGLWCLESHFVVWGCRGSVRMTLIETGDGIVIYSPVALSASHIEQIHQMGEVSAIIAPNLFHHLFLRPCIAEFPRARALVPQGLMEKIGPIPGAEVMAEGFDIGGRDELDCHIFAGHKLRETVLFHRPTGTLITADLLYNLQHEHFTAEKLFFRTIGCFGKPGVAFYHRFAVRDKASLRRLIGAVRHWGVSRIVMSHGRIVNAEAASEIFAGAWQRFA
jgi:hypothetical protein